MNKNIEKLLRDGLVEKYPIEYFENKLGYLYVNANIKDENMEDLWRMDEKKLIEIGYNKGDASQINRLVGRVNYKMRHESFYVNENGFWVCGRERDGIAELRDLESHIQWFDYQKPYYENNEKLIIGFSRIMSYLLKLEFHDSYTIRFGEKNLVKNGLIDESKSLILIKTEEFIDDFAEYKIGKNVNIEIFADLLISAIEKKNIRALNGLEKLYGDLGSNGNVLLFSAIYKGSDIAINWLLPRLKSLNINYKPPELNKKNGSHFYEIMKMHPNGMRASELAELVELRVGIIDKLKNVQERCELMETIKNSQGYNIKSL